MPFIGPCRRQKRNAILCGEFDGSQRADVGIGPYETVLICTAPHPRRRVQSKALCAADGTENLLLGSQIVITPSNRYNLKQRTRVLTKTVGTLVLYCTSSLEPLGYQKGRGPFVEAARAAQPLLSNFFLAARHHSSLRS